MDWCVLSQDKIPISPSLYSTKILLLSLNWEVLQLFKNCVREKVKLDRLPRESVKTMSLENFKIWLDKTLDNWPGCDASYVVIQREKELISRSGHRSLSHCKANTPFEYWKPATLIADSVFNSDGPTNAVQNKLCVTLPTSLQKSVTSPTTQPKWQKSMKLCRNPVKEQKTTLNHYFCLPLETNLICSAEFLFDRNSNWAGTILVPAKQRNIWFQSLSAGLKRPKDFQNS